MNCIQLRPASGGKSSHRVCRPRIEPLEQRLPPGRLAVAVPLEPSWIGVNLAPTEMSGLPAMTDMIAANADTDSSRPEKANREPVSSELIPIGDLSSLAWTEGAMRQAPFTASTSASEHPTLTCCAEELGQADWAAMSSLWENATITPPTTPLQFTRGNAQATSAVFPSAVPGASIAAPSTASLGDAARGASGFSWQQSFQGGNWVFEDVSFANPTTGMAVAELGKVLRTQDGGATWNTVLNLGFPYYWYGVHSFDAQTAVLSGFNDQTGDGIVRWTFDGGQTWTDDIVMQGSPDPIRWLDKIAFADGQHGLTTASLGATYHTATGGQSAGDWTFARVDPSLGWLMGNFTLRPDGNAWAAGISFCHSSDFGQDWSCQHSADSVFDGGGTSFPDATHGWVGGGEISPAVAGWVHRTTDGGQTWGGRILNAPFPIRSVLFLNDEVGFAAGGNVYTGVGGIYSTVDGGTTWNLDLNTGAEMKSIQAVRTSRFRYELWAAGFDSNFTGTIYHTSVSLLQPPLVAPAP